MAEPVKRRVLIGATSFCDARQVIALGIDLARQIDGEIFGLLAEEDEILRYAAFSSARIMSSERPEISPVTSDSMLIAFRGDARAFHDKLASEANKASISWSFQHLRGQLISLLNQGAHTGDLILFGYRRPPVPQGGIVLVSGSAAPAQELTDLALGLATRQHVPLVVLTLPGPDGASTVALPKSGGNQPRFFSFEDTAAMLKNLNLMSPTAVLVAGDGMRDLDIKALVDTARCPVIVASTA